jgi:tellurite resistance protein TehA-like permease
LLNSVFKKVTKSIDGTQFSYLVAIVLLGASLYPINIANLNFLQNTIYKYGVLISIFVISFGILIWANLKFKHEQKVGGKK